MLWLWASARHAAGTAPPRWLVWVTLGACAVIALVMILIALVSAGTLLAAGTAATAGLLLLRLARRLRAATRTGQPLSPVAPAILAVAPIILLAAQSALADSVTTFARNHVIANSATLIAQIEQHRIRHGAYPESLLAVWGDYKPSIVGVERYYYEPSGHAYNVVFEEPSLVFGAEQFAVYNPRDEQRMMGHTQDRVLLAGPELEANAGYRAVHALPQPHWKVFIFD